MKHHSITCDWCGEKITTHHIGYQDRHVGVFATWEGARYDFEFCNDEHLDAWRAHGRSTRKYVEHVAEQFADVSDEDLEKSHVLGSDVERRRRSVAR